MYKRIATSALVFGTLALAPPAEAQIPCFEREALTARLAEQYGERRAGAGLQDARTLIEIWTSPESGSWTLLVTRPDGMSCVIATGGAWQDGPPVAALTDDGMRAAPDTPRRARIAVAVHRDPARPPGSLARGATCATTSRA